MNHVSYRYGSALFPAADNKNIKCVKLLIEKGAYISVDLIPDYPTPELQVVEKSHWILFAAGVHIYVHTFTPEEEMSLKHLAERRSENICCR